MMKKTIRTATPIEQEMMLEHKSVILRQMSMQETSPILLICLLLLAFHPIKIHSVHFLLYSVFIY